MNIGNYKNVKPDPAAKREVCDAVTEKNAEYIGALSALPEQKPERAVWRTVGTVAAVLVAVVAVTAWLLIGLGMRNARVQPDDGEGVRDVENTPAPADTTEDVGSQDEGQPEQSGKKQTAKSGFYRVTCKNGDVTPHETVQAFVNAYAAGKPCTLVYEDGAGTVTCVIDGGGAVKKTTEGTPDGQSYSVFPNDSHGASKLMLDRDAHEYKLFLYGSTAGANSNYGKTDDFNLDFGKADYINYSGENNSRVFDSAKSAPVLSGENGEYVSGAESVLYYFRQRMRGKYAAMTVNGDKYCYRNGSDKISDGLACTLRISYNNGNNTVNLISSRRLAVDVIGNEILISLPAYDAVSSRLAFCPGSYMYSVFRDGVSASVPMTEEQMSRLEAAIDAEEFPAIALDIYDYEPDVMVGIGEYNVASFKGKEYKNIVSVYPSMNADPEYGPRGVSDAFIKVLNDLADELVQPAEQTDGYENPLDPDRLFSNAQISPPQTARVIDAADFPKTRRMTYAAMPDGGLGFSADDKKRNIAPEGATLTFRDTVKTTYAARQYTLGYYLDENANVYGFNGEGRLIEFYTCGSGDISAAPEQSTPYSPELDRELKDAAKTLARALYGGELDKYEQVEQEYPGDFDFSAWRFSSVSYVIRRGVQTFSSVQVVVYSDYTVYVHVEPEEIPEINYGIYDDLTKENLTELIGRRLKRDAGNDKAYLPKEGEFVFDFLFEYDGHVYQRIAYDADPATTDGSDFDRKATQCYYYRVD